MFENREAQLINVVNAGVQPSYCRVTSKNNKYFAYSAFLAAYVIDQETFKAVYILARADVAVSTIALANKNFNLISVAYQNNITDIINFATNQIIASFSTPEVLVSLCWAEKHNILVGFSKLFDSVYTFNVDDGGQYKVIKGSFPNIRTMTTFDLNGPIFVGGNDVGNFSKYDYVHGKVTEFKPQVTTSKVCAVDVDPNSMSVISVWRDGTWVLYDATQPDLQLLNKNDKLLTQFGAGCWVSDPPGHFITGDSKSGVIRLWNSSSTSPIDSFTIHTSGILALLRLNGNRVLCGFTDGMLAVMDMKTRKLIWRTNAAHRNTIFQLQFLPNQPEYLMSCGAEGSICTWDVSTMRLVDRATPQKSLGNIFSMVVTPGGGYTICGDINGEIGVFSNKTSSLIYQEKVAKDRIVNLSISTADPNMLLLGSYDGVVVMYNLQEKRVVREFKSENVKYVGCAFSPHDGNEFAVTRSDGFVELYSSFQGALTKAIDAGKFDLYGITYSPHIPNLLAVTSNDGPSVLINCAEEEHVTCIIHVHLRPSRVVAFHPTLPNIVASSGYDGKVAIYDIEAKSTLYVLQAHAAYCYAVAFSPLNPYMMLTSGCDTTIKLWTLDRLFAKRQLEATLSKNLVVRPMPGAKDLVKLSRRISRSSDVKLTFSPNDIIHINDMTRINEKLVRKMTSVSPTEGNRIKQAIKQRERLIQAAEIELKMGNVKKYCEFMFNAGEHMKAVAAAPSVSVKFWESMLKACADVTDDQNQRLPMLLALGDTDAAVKWLTDENKLDDAMLVSCAAKSGAYKYKVAETEQQQQQQQQQHPYSSKFESEQELNEYSIMSGKARKDLNDGLIYLAASDFLSVGDVDSAMATLLNNGELLTAEMINQMFGMFHKRTSELFALACINENLSTEVLKYVGAEVAERVVNSVPFPDINERNKFYAEIGLKSTEEFAKVEAATLPQKIHQMLIVGETQAAVTKTIQYMKETLVKSEFDFIELREIIREFEYASISSIPLEDQQQIVLCAHIVAVYESIFKGLKTVYKKLIEIIGREIQEDCMEWAAPIHNELQKLQTLLPPQPNVTIRMVGCNIINNVFVGMPCDPELKYGPIIPLDEDINTKISLQTMFEFQQVTMFSPSGECDKYILF